MLPLDQAFGGGIELRPPPNILAMQGRILADLLLGDGPFAHVND